MILIHTHIMGDLILILINVVNLFLFCRSTPVLASSPGKTLPERCTECLRYMDDPDLKLFPGDSDDAVGVSLADSPIVFTSLVLCVYCKAIIHTISFLNQHRLRVLKLIILVDATEFLLCCKCFPQGMKLHCTSCLRDET